MYDTTDNQSKKPLIAFIAIAATVIFVIITISVIGINLSNNNQANIANQSSSGSLISSGDAYTSNNSGLITEDQLAEVKAKLYTHLKKTKSADKNFDVVVRWDTVKKTSNAYPSTSFLVDIDEYQQTYRITVAEGIVEITCPELSESKYPESFCIGNTGDYDDSINIVFGEELPLGGTTEAGDYFSIFRGDTSSAANPSDRYLEVYLYTCSWNEESQNLARSAAEDLIASRGAPPKLFDIKITYGGGCHSE